MAKMNLRAGKVAIKIILLFVILGLIFYSVKLLTPIKAEVPNPGGDMVGSVLAWTNSGGDMLWRNPANWNSGVPTANDKATIKDMLVSGPIIDSDTSAAALKLVLSDGLSSSETLEITGGTLTTSGWFVIGHGVGNDGTFNVSGGTTSVGTHLDVGFGGTGHLNMTGGSITVSDLFGIATQTTGTGDVHLDGGTISCGSFIMQTGATMAIGGGTLIVDGDETASINGYISSGRLTAYDGSGSVVADYDVTNPGKTTVTAGSGEKACYPDPSNDANGVSINADLSWTAGANAVSHDVYFGTDPTPDESEFVGNQTELTFEAGTMEPASTYYWRIDEKNAFGTTCGEVWSFITQTKAGEKMEQLLAEYGSDERLLERVKHVANKYAEEYFQVGEYEKSLGLYGYVLDNCSEAEAVLLAKVGIGMSHIYMNEDEQVEAVVDALIADFNDLPRVDWGLFMIGEGYYYLAEKMERQELTTIAGEKYRKAMDVWRRIIDDLPETENTTRAWYFSGVCYIRLKEYEKTIAYFEKVIEEWPDYEYAWSAQHLIGTYANILMESGKMTLSEAEPKIETAWQAMVDNYVGKPLYNDALRKLGGFYLERGQAQKAIGYFETFCEEYPEDRWRAEVLYDLAGAYEAIGEPALAADVYEEFIADYPDAPQAAQAQDRLAELGGTD